VRRLLAHGRVEHGDLPRVDGPFDDNEMRVVDISQLTGVPQDLIVTSVISEIWELAETGRLGVDKLIIFVDELNKYAPAGNSRTSSLKTRSLTSRPAAGTSTSRSSGRSS
jgi:DNA helicase HerA-like ATPase